MAINGHWENGRYVPEPSVRLFEIALGALIAARPCAGCGLPLGNSPRRMCNRKHYHPACADTLNQQPQSGVKWMSMSKRPVAWRCKDYADGWIIFQDEAAANAYHEQTECLMQGLYVRDGSETLEDENARLRAALKPFMEAASDLAEDHRDGSPIWESPAAMSIDAADLRQAARAYQQSTKPAHAR